MSADDDPFTRYNNPTWGYSPYQATPVNSWIGLYQAFGGIILWTLGGIIGVGIAIISFLTLLFLFGWIEMTVITTGGVFPVLWSLLAAIGISLFCGALGAFIARYGLAWLFASTIREEQSDFEYKVL